jgi:hypothetical protein
VWPHLVVFPTPSSDQNLRLYERVEDLSVQELIAKLAEARLAIFNFIEGWYNTHRSQGKGYEVAFYGCEYVRKRTCVSTII